MELEKRIHSIQSDRDGLSAALDEATDRIMMLERQTREQEIQVKTKIFVSDVSNLPPPVHVIFVDYSFSKLFF